jgi:hypothetical protein
LLIEPKDAREFQLLTDLLSKMKVKTKVLSLEEKEDIGLAELMKETDRSIKVSRENIMNKLRK